MQLSGLKGMMQGFRVYGCRGLDCCGPYGTHICIIYIYIKKTGQVLGDMSAGVYLWLYAPAIS